MMWGCWDLITVEGNAHNKNGNGKIGGVLQIEANLQKHSSRCLSYRGQDMRTCSTVSMAGHVGHLSVDTMWRLSRDWLSRARLKRSRANVEASDGERVVK